ncbi:MAG TPA: ATP phosphoribosyltransferase regulatory subunit [Longimicrobium sp.]
MPTSPIAQVPPGSLDLLAGDVRRRRRVQRAWFALAEAHGYQEVIPPTFEYEEVFTRGAGPELAARLIRFVDRDGRLVALRADFTSAIARVVATRLADAPGPLRLAYAGKVYRQEPEGLGRRREIFQLGAELIGDPSPEADVEALRLVILQMRALGLHEFQINLGDIRFIRPLLSGLSPEQAEALRTAIDRKDRAALAAGAREIGAPAAVTRALVVLPELIGRGDVLTRAHALASGREAEEAIDRLRRVDALLGDDERRHVVYDLGEIRGLGYYSGIQFEVFVAGVGRAVGFGGRYDGLLALYGADRPAVGFALETDALADLLDEEPS